jgi:hypothetical protein
MPELLPVQLTTSANVMANKLLLEPKQQIT